MDRCRVVMAAFLSIAVLAACSGGREAPVARADASPTEEATPTPSPSRPVNNKKLIAQTWKDYKDAAFFGDGEDAVELLVSGTTVYFDEIRRMAYSAGPRAIARRPVIDRILIGALRMRFAVGRLRKMEMGALLTFVMEKNLATGERGALNKLEIVNIRVDDDDGRAVLQLKMKSKPKERPLGLDLFREGNAWKIDLMPIFRGTSSGLVALARDRGIGIDEFISAILEVQMGESVPPELCAKPKG